MTVSAIYRGSVVHARVRPVRHRLRYRMLNLLLDLDELPVLSRRLALFGHNRRAVFAFHDADHGDASATPLRAQVEALLRAAGLDPDGGRIRVLCMPRVLGMVFNPISVFFCHAADGAVQAMVYEVNNTFGQRHSYLIPVGDAAGGTIRQRCDKRFYVSPFMDMGLTYSFRVAVPGETASLAIDARDGDGPLLFAAFTGRRRALTDAQLGIALLSNALLAARVMGGIHWEALKLWGKGLRLRPRPTPPAAPVTITSQGHRP
jgi:DUF1365 family protein